MKRRFLLVFISQIAFALSPFTAFAHSNAQKIEIDTYHFTDAAYYIDLLIKMDSEDEYYTEFNNDNMNHYDFDKTKLAEYRDEEGYISFSCHYKDIYSDLIINKKIVRDTLISENCFTLDKNLKENIYAMKDIYDEKRSFKIAILDNEGSIIQVSDSFEVHNDDKDKGYIASDVEYDISDNKLEYYWSNNYPTDSGIKIYNKPLALCVILIILALIILFIYVRTCNKLKTKQKDE